MDIPNFKDREELFQFLRFCTDHELSYILSRYCGPSNLLLREKVFKYPLSDKLQRMVNDEIAYRAIDEIFVNSDT